MSTGFYVPDAKFTPWWWEAAPRNAPIESALPPSCDVAIIGAGFTGLSAAITLARAGRDVVVFDAEDAGFGASTRNGGMIGSGHRVPYEELSKQYGEPVAEEVLREGMRSLDFTTELIGSEAIECDFKRTGRFRGAWRAADYDMIAREVDFLKNRIGLDAHMVSRTEQHREVAVDQYHGGCVYNAHGGLHPAKLHAGLHAKAMAAGARVFNFTPVHHVAKDGNNHVVATSRGSVNAAKVIVATNGYTRQATPTLQKRLIPIASYMIATDVLGKEKVDALIPSGRMIVETRSRHCYYRPSPDGERILLGGRASLSAIDTRKSGEILRNLLVGLFPVLSDVKISHSWLGMLGFSNDHLPRIGQTEDGMFFATGYSGSGVAMAPYLGWRIANKVLGNEDGKTGFDTLNFPPVKFHSFIPVALPFVNMWYRWKDVVEGS